MDVLILEPFYSGAHRSFIDHLRRRIGGRSRLIATPGKKWQWRMRTSGLYFADRVRRLRRPPDLILASSFLNIAEMRGALPARWRTIPVILYFHENQLAYPNRTSDVFDWQFSIIQMVSALSADSLIFNSRYNRDTFLQGVSGIPSRFKTYFPKNLAPALRRKSTVMPVPIILPRGPAPRRHGPLCVLWNHRWEHDKNPEEFFDVLIWLDRKNYDFRLHVCGEHFREIPDAFTEAQRKLRHRIDHWGFVQTRREYQKILQTSDVVVSTARQEFFGVAVLEAVAAGCRPLVPDRLSYREIYPPEARYRTKAEWRTRLSQWMHQPDRVRRDSWGWLAAQYTWAEWGGKYEQHFREVAARAAQ